MAEPIDLTIGIKATIAQAQSAIASRRAALGLAAPAAVPSDAVEPQGASGRWIVCPWCRSPRWYASLDLPNPDDGRRTLVICGACGRPFFTE